MANHPEIVVLCSLALLVVLLFVSKIRAAALFAGLAVAFLAMGLGQPDAFYGAFANPSVVTIFLIIFLTAALRKLYDFNKILLVLARGVKTPSGFLARTLPSIALFSGVLNNTPIVTLLTPAFVQWGEQHKVSASKLLIPLSFATLAGGMLTLIGTSTNLVLNGLLTSSGLDGLTLLDFFLPGLAVVIPIVLFLILFAHRLLPARTLPTENFRIRAREYFIEMGIMPGSPILGLTVEAAQLRNLPGVFLAEIRRKDQTLAPVAPHDVIQPGDILLFVGDTRNMATLFESRFGLRVEQGDKLHETLPEVVEAMIPYSSPLANQRVKDTGFRQQYNAAILAIHRNGERMEGRIGDVELRPGDLLLLMPGKSFWSTMERTRDLLPLEIHAANLGPQKKQRLLFWFSLVALLVPTLTGWLSFNLFLLLLVGVLYGTGVLNRELVLKNLNLELWIMLGSALFVGQVVLDSGAAQLAIQPLLEGARQANYFTALAVVLCSAALLTNLMSNAAAVSILFPLVLEWTLETGFSVQGMMLALAFGASCAFLLPIGYQTHMIVSGPGGYKNVDFLRVGLPVTLLYLAAALLTIFALSS
jgi:di/tricarboxylate transporter